MRATVQIRRLHPERQSVPALSDPGRGGAPGDGATARRIERSESGLRPVGCVRHRVAPRRGRPDRRCTSVDDFAFHDDIGRIRDRPIGVAGTAVDLIGHAVLPGEHEVVTSSGIDRVAAGTAADDVRASATEQLVRARATVDEIAAATAGIGVGSRSADEPLSLVPRLRPGAACRRPAEGTGPPSRELTSDRVSSSAPGAAPVAPSA